MCFDFIILEVFVCECATTSTLIVGEGGKIMSEGRGTFTIVLSPARFPNVCVQHCRILRMFLHYTPIHTFAE